MGLEKTLKDLIIKLNRPLLFFIPMDFIPKENLEKFNAIEKEKFFDRIIIYNNDSQLNNTISGADYIQLLEKPTLLSCNILRLVDEEADLNSSQFTTLLENYSMHLRFFVFISKWMADNLDAHCNIKTSINGHFKFQKDAYQYHKQELETKFDLQIITDLTSREILKYIKKDTPSTFSEVINKRNKTQVNIKSERKDMYQRPNTKKQLLITDKEAREFLLEMVFNQYG